MKFKSVIAAFLFILLSSFLALAIVIHTKSFGGLLTKVITDITERKTKTKVSIKNIALSVFPPGIEFNRVRIFKQISPEESLSAEFGKLGFYISFIEVEEKKLTFGEIRISDSVIDYRKPESLEETPKEIEQKLINDAFKMADDAPVAIDTLLIENTKISVNHEVLEAKRLKIFKKKDSLIARFHLANIRPTKDELSLDEVWGDAEISRSQIRIDRLKLQHDVQTVVVRGVINNYNKLLNSDLNLKGEASVHLKSILTLAPKIEQLNIQEGIAHFLFDISSKNEVLNGQAQITVEDLESNFLNAKKLELALTLKERTVILSKAELENNEERLHLLNPAVLYDFHQQRIFPAPILAQVKNLDLNNVLGILGPSFRPLKGELNGEMSFVYRNGDMFFKPKDGFVIHGLGFVVGEPVKPFEIIMVKQATIKETEIAIIKGEFHLTSVIDLPSSHLEVDGYVNKKEVRFSVIDGKIDLEDLGNISQIDIKGKGTLSVNVSGPPSETLINLKGKTKGFEVLGYRLGEATKDITIDLRDSTVFINDIDAKYGQTALSGSGSVNYENSDIALGINAPMTNYNDLSQILHPVFSKLDFLPSDLEFTARVDADIYGKTKLNDLKIKSNVSFNDLTAYGEMLNHGSFKVGMAQQEVSIEGLEAEKGKGAIRGDFFFKIPTKKMRLKYQWENLLLSSFNIIKKTPLGMDGRISGSISGEGHSDDLVLNLNSNIFDTKSGNYRFDDSLIKMSLSPKLITGKIDLLGKSIHSDFNYHPQGSALSNVNVNVNINNIKPVYIALLGQHLETEQFTGKLRFDLASSFTTGFNNFDLKGTLRDLEFKHSDFNVIYNSNTPQYLIQNSHIKKWDLNIRQPDIFIVSKGQGTFGKSVSLVHEVHLNSKILEILLAPVLSADGFMRNIIKVDGKGSNYDLSVSSKATGNNISLENVPIPINNLNYSIDYSDKRLFIKELSTSLDNGIINLKGDVFFQGPQPDVNIKFMLDRAEIPILGKSVINLSGEGLISGNEAPYSISGELIVNKAQIVNELTEFNTKSSGVSQVRFLPKQQDSSVASLISLNMNVKAENLIRITNSLMDVGLRGEVRVTGNPIRPRAEGRVFSPGNTSKVTFKNNTYFITNADINFSQKKDIGNPNFDIQAATLISTYRVYAKAYGDLEHFNFDLTSDPVLPRNSILSLIAFGYTDEIQSTLSYQERQQLNQVGVGSFVFDRFQISDMLNKQFGLQVNLGTVVEQSQFDSLLSGRTQDGQGNTIGRTRSATKIELRKRLDEALSLSVSSTMGGNIGQRQSMNLNYSLNKKVQLEGVYELRTNDEGVEDIIDNSIGGDLKFRWTFK